MRLRLTLIAAIASCVAGRVLDVSQVTPNTSQMGPRADRSTGRPATPPHENPLRHVGRKIKFKRDGSVQGFFDEDYANDADWKKFTEKGGALVSPKPSVDAVGDSRANHTHQMCGLNGDDKEAGLQIGDTRIPPSAASPWTGDLRQEMSAWKWSEINPSTYSCKMNGHWKVPEAMKALGLDGKPQSEGGDNVCYRVEHWNPKPAENGRQIPAINQWYTVDGTQYQVCYTPPRRYSTNKTIAFHNPSATHARCADTHQATRAHYEFGLNPLGGAIYGFFLDSPVHAAATLWHNNRKPADATKLPKLRAFSDVLWGYWNRDNPDVKNVKFFFMMGISNDQTNALVATCLRKKKEVLKEWPGVEFDTGSDEGHALLGEFYGKWGAWDGGAELNANRKSQWCSFCLFSHAA